MSFLHFCLIALGAYELSNFISPQHEFSKRTTARQIIARLNSVDKETMKQRSPEERMEFLAWAYDGNGKKHFINTVFAFAYLAVIIAMIFTFNPIFALSGLALIAISIVITKSPVTLTIVRLDCLISGLLLATPVFLQGILH